MSIKKAIKDFILCGDEYQNNNTTTTHRKKCVSKQVAQAREKAHTLEQALMKADNQTGGKKLIYLNHRLFLVDELTADYENNEFLKWVYHYKYASDYKTLDRIQLDTMLSIIESTARIKVGDLRNAQNKNELLKVFKEYYNELD